MMLILATCSAQAGELHVTATADSLMATSTNEQPATGPATRSNHGDLGARLLIGFQELDHRLRVDVDYRGRLPFLGEFKNSRLSLLYKAEASYTTVDKRWRLGAGRFLAPTPVFLPMDGVRVRYEYKGWSASVFAGRRGITTSRTHVGLSTFLPAVGARFGLIRKTWQAHAVAAWSQDTFLHVGSPEQPTPVGGLSGVARAAFLPKESLRFGGQLTLHQQARYLLGPTWSESTVEVEAPQLFGAMGFLTWRPTDQLRLDADAIHQAPAVFAAGTIEGTERIADLSPTTFTDVRLRARLGAKNAKGWLRPLIRFRVRPDRSELRMGLQAEWNDVFLPGLYLNARGSFDDIYGEEQTQNVGVFDRTFGRAALGYRKDGFDVRGGGSFVERALTPSSGRQGSAGQPAAHEDLHPFLLEADPIVFAKAFYSRRTWFAGVDIEKHLTESEFRVLLQVGLNTRATW